MIIHTLFMPIHSSFILHIQTCIWQLLNKHITLILFLNRRIIVQIRVHTLCSYLYDVSLFRYKVVRLHLRDLKGCNAVLLNFVAKTCTVRKADKCSSRCRYIIICMRFYVCLCCSYAIFPVQTLDGVYYTVQHSFRCH